MHFLEEQAKQARLAEESRKAWLDKQDTDREKQTETDERRRKENRMRGIAGHEDIYNQLCSSLRFRRLGYRGMVAATTDSHSSPRHGDTTRCRGQPSEDAATTSH